MSAITRTIVLLAGLTCVFGAGIQTSLEEYPSIVQVESRIITAWLQQCVGNILTNYHILSTASCFPGENAETRRIRAGAATRGTGGFVHPVTRIIHNPNYGLMDQDGDIAVIRLTDPLSFAANIQQAAIIGEGIYLPENLGLTLVGWGTTAEGGSVGDDYLYSANVYTVNDDTCLETYIGKKIVTENMICVRQLGSSGLDYDSRDAGAPIIYSGTTTGLVAFGESNSDNDFPVVSTAIASYTSWIIDTASQL